MADTREEKFTDEHILGILAPETAHALWRFKHWRVDPEVKRKIIKWLEDK